MEAGVSIAETSGIRVTVQSEFRPEQSAPAQGRYLFSYTVRIANRGNRAARLISRHWVIADAGGACEEVVGEGVVGRQPHLEPGEQFEYTSYCVLKTPHGSMHGTYHMVCDDGQAFDAEIAPFSLVVPGDLN
jgi:ApaG protein